MCRLFVLICLLLYALSPVSAQLVIYADEGKDLLYTCPLEAPVSWTVDGNGLTANSSEHTIYPNGSILITPVTNPIIGTGASNKCCRLSDNVCSYFFIFQASINAPTAKNMTVLEYSDVTLICNADTQPPPTFSWYRDAVLISSNREHQLINVSREDSGAYTCSITNSLGVRSIDMQLSVEYAPTISSLDTGVRYLTVGDTVNLTCEYTGKPFPVVMWYLSKDGELSGASEIPNPNVVYDSADSVRLVLASVRGNSTGFYFCFANNIRGNSSTRFQVIVRTIPQAPTVKIIDTTAISITIKWSYTDNGNSPITRTFLEHKANNSVWQNNLVSGNLTTGFTFTQLLANTAYTIRVSVRNAIGMSPSALTAAVTRPLSAPEPRRVMLRVLSQTALVLVWDPPVLTFEYSPVTRYEHQMRLLDGGTWSSLVYAYSAGRVEFTDLSAGTFYQARVKAVNSAGASLFVTVHNMTMYTTPGSPVLSAVPLDFHTIRVSWLPRSTGGSPLLTWSIEILSTSGVWSLLHTLATSETLYEITNLQPNTTYSIRILVANMLGNSPYSVAMVATHIKGQIAAVSSATAEMVTHNSITLSWLPVVYDDISEGLEYQIEYSLANSLLPTSENTTEKTSYSFQGLEPLSTYRFSIIARDGNDVSVRPLVLYYTTTLPPIQIVIAPSTPVLGDNFQLSCIFSEKYKGVYSPDHVAWYKEGVEVRLIPQNTQPNDFYLYKNHLVFPTFESSVYGNYSCRVRDMYTYKYISEEDALMIDLLRKHMEIFILAAATLGCFITFLCLMIVVLCCLCCCRKRRRARIARNHVGIPKKSWKNASPYSPLSGDTSGLNSLRTEVDTHHGPRTASQPDRLLEPEGEGVYTTSFMHNSNDTPENTLERPLMRAAFKPTNLNKFEAASNQPSDVAAPAPPPPFSSHDVFGDSGSLPKRLTITEGLNTFRYEREEFGSPPSSIVTAPNLDDFSSDSGPQHLYQNLKMENEAQHVQGIEIINIPKNCISSDI